jgi:hypothetical protein
LPSRRVVMIDTRPPCPRAVPLDDLGPCFLDHGERGPGARSGSKARALRAFRDVVR